MKMTEFKPPKPLETPVLFLVFNRLDTTRKVFEAIRKAKPKKLYIAADGARENKEGEETKVKNVREYVLNNIDWDCEIKTLFRDKNLGCKFAVSSAIDWFFDNEEMGIILEDDVLPSQSFFWYCQDLLNKYKDDTRIGQISGVRRFDKLKTNDKYSYFFSIYGSIWGWASWRRAWKLYNVNINADDIKEAIFYGLDKRITFSPIENKLRLKIWNKVINNEVDTWDFQWGFIKFINSMLSIVPNKNLITNVGFGEDSTHTHKELRENILVRNELEFPLKHPKYIVPYYDYDRQFSRLFVNTFIKNKLKGGLQFLTGK